MTKHHYNLGLLFEEVMALHAPRPALRYLTATYDYRQLSKWIDALAAVLTEQGLTRGDVVAIGNSKRPLSYALMHAALRLGVAYVNIDVASPASRTARILSTSGASLLCFDVAADAAAMESLAENHGCPCLFLEESRLPVVSPQDRREQERLSRLVDGACIAYIMFTSGSTGIPKGVAVTHQNILSFIAWGQARFHISDQDCFAGLSPMYFDNSVFDFYIGFFSGACLSPVYRELLTSPIDLANFVGKTQCTVWFSVPSLLMYLMTMKAMTSELMPSLRTIVFGGEGYPKVELKKLYGLFSNRAELVNVYGPTECTCICSAYTLTDADFSNLTGLPPLGNLNPNFDYRIVDDAGQDSLSGELFLIGPNVAAGYYGDLKQTAQAFHVLFEPRRYFKRMYRTGDIVREENGVLYFVGRRDNQIKHMGYRIELEEIEHALNQIADVNQAAVLYHRTDSAYGKIVAFVAGNSNLEEAALLKALAVDLPNYMVPHQCVFIPVLPKNPNGKVDRQGLIKLLPPEGKR